jgi:hypothetical protein
MLKILRLIAAPPNRPTHHRDRQRGQCRQKGTGGRNDQVVKRTGHGNPWATFAAKQRAGLHQARLLGKWRQKAPLMTRLTCGEAYAMTAGVSRCSLYAILNNAHCCFFQSGDPRVQIIGQTVGPIRVPQKTISPRAPVALSGAVVILTERSWLLPTSNCFQGHRHHRWS